MTASLTDEADPSRHLLPSEYLTCLYFIQRGEPLTDARADFIQAETAAWLEPLKPPRAKADAVETRTAYQARRTQDTKFGPFEFAPEKPPAFAPVIPCGRWENVIRSPALQWLELYAGVACLDLDPTDDGHELAAESI